MAVIKYGSRYLVFTLIGIFCALRGFGQSAPNTYFVQFTDKLNTPYSVTAPLQFLSQRAVDRRVKHGIAVTAQDLPVDPVYIDSVLSYDSVTLKCVSKWFNAITVTITDTNSLQAIQSLGFVNQVRASKKLVKQPFYDKFMFPYERGNDFFTSHDIYGLAYNQIHMMNGEFLHHKGYWGNGMWIGVMDAGYGSTPFMSCFNTAFSENRIFSQYDFPDSEPDVFNTNSTHGTLVLSTMAGDIPGEYVGTAPKASYYLWVTENAPSEYLVEEDYWVAGAEQADSAGVDVINTSLGYSLFDDTLTHHTYSQMDGNTTRISIGTDIAVSKGMICVNSAGNSGGNSWFYITAPADADSVLTVGAVGPNGAYASFSSKGPSFDGRVKPNVATQGYQAQVYWIGNYVAAGNGTSFSSPIMAGMVACLWQAFPNKKNMEIVHAIEQSASQYTSPDSLIGYGIPNMKKAYDILSGNTTAGNEPEVLLFQNVYGDETTLQIYSPVAGNITMEIYDAAGKRLESDHWNFAAAEYKRIQLTGKLSMVSPGMYFLKISSGNYTRLEKMIKR